MIIKLVIFVMSITIILIVIIIMVRNKHAKDSVHNKKNIDKTSMNFKKALYVMKRKQCRVILR